MNAVVISSLGSPLLSLLLHRCTAQLTQSLVASRSFRDPSSHLSPSDSLVLLPACQSVSLHLSSLDVIHSYGINSLSSRFDCVPGRLSSSYHSHSSIVGLNKGYCYELCGIGHFSMQIKVIII